MKKLFKIVNILTVISCILMTLPGEFQIQAEEKAPKIIGKSAIVIDVETGDVLYEKNPSVKHYPASITKCMTALVVLENRKLDDTVKFSEEALSSIESGSSAAYIKPGEIMTVEESLYVMMLHSANDVAHGLAYDIGGNLSGFAQMMNEKAKQLGCTNTNFVNASGLHNENHYTTAADMAKIAQAAYHQKTLLKIMETVQYKQPATNLTNNVRTWINGNRMIREGSEYYYEPCLGGKTGYTMTAGGTLVTYAKIQNRVLACVILKSKNSATAYEDSIKLYDYVGKNKNLSVQERSTVKSNDDDTLPLIEEENRGFQTVIQNLKAHWIFVLLGILILLYIKKRIQLARKRRAWAKARAKAKQRQRRRRSR